MILYGFSNTKIVIHLQIFLMKSRNSTSPVEKDSGQSTQSKYTAVEELNCEED